MRRFLFALTAGLLVGGILTALAASNGEEPPGLASGGFFVFAVITAVAWGGLTLARLPRPRARPLPQEPPGGPIAEEAAQWLP
jgi:hypothetical protein